MKKCLLAAVLLTAACVLPLAAATKLRLRALPDRLLPPQAELEKVQFLSREGEPLSRTYANVWNYQQQASLEEIPPLLLKAVIAAEDRRFFSHSGNDYKSILGAMRDAVIHRRIVRGGSTISEQVLRMLHPRPRTVWSRWLEFWEARRLEMVFSKGEILEFYLNQVPFARNRRGVKAAALDLFDRDLSTLSPRESLLLAVLIRAPSRLDPRRAAASELAWRIEALAESLWSLGQVSEEQLSAILSGEYELSEPSLEIEASHFVRYLKKRSKLGKTAGGSLFPYVRTSLDAGLQRAAQDLLGRRVVELGNRGVSAGSVLVVENRTGKILAWVNQREIPDSHDEAIDAVLTRRQPGSTLKPFVYAQAMERGWTPATIIDDSPLLRPVSVGLKQYRNYSGKHYGLVRLREALGNSLNIPAVRAAEFVTAEALYVYLREFGFEGLTKSVQHYGEGLALGNAEVSLFELVRAYSVLARGGVYKNISGLLSSHVESAKEKRIVSRAVSSIVGNILSDENARQLEFSGSGLLSFPAQTAVKTGTSSDYRDAWAVGYNDGFTVGVWMGSLDYRPMKQVTGSNGPGIVLRAVFAELSRRTPTAPLFLDPELVRASICEATGRAACGDCNAIDELFVPGTMPGSCEDVSEVIPKSDKSLTPHIKIQLPTENLRLALDPRIPDSLEKFPFTIGSEQKVSRVLWYVNDELVGESSDKKFLWPLSAGEKTLKALVWVGEHKPVWTDNVRFFVR